MFLPQNLEWKKAIRTCEFWPELVLLYITPKQHPKSVTGCAPCHLCKTTIPKTGGGNFTVHHMLCTKSIPHMCGMDVCFCTYVTSKHIPIPTTSETLRVARTSHVATEPLTTPRHTSTIPMKLTPNGSEIRNVNVKLVNAAANKILTKCFETRGREQYILTRPRWHDDY